MAADSATLYVIGGSHACRTGMLLLEHKSVSYRTVELPTGMHPIAVRLLGFSGSREPIRSVDGTTNAQLKRLDRLGTVPALRHRGRRVQTNTAIVAYLERVVPEPPLYPADPALREQVEQAREFGDEPLQMASRRAVLAAAVAGLDRLHRRGAEGRLGPLLAGNEPMRRLLSGMAARFTFKAGAARSDELGRAVLPMLDRIDGWVADGVLGGEQPNVADLTIAPSLALLDYRLDLREELRGRPCFAMVERLLPAAG